MFTLRAAFMNSVEWPIMPLLVFPSISAQLFPISSSFVIADKTNCNIEFKITHRFCNATNKFVSPGTDHLRTVARVTFAILWTLWFPTVESCKTCAYTLGIGKPHDMQSVSPYTCKTTRPTPVTTVEVDTSRPISELLVVSFKMYEHHDNILSLHKPAVINHHKSTPVKNNL